MTPIEEIGKLGKYGLTGIMLALIILTLFCVGCIYRISTYHMEQTIVSNKEISDSNIKVAEAISELSLLIKLPNRISLK